MKPILYIGNHLSRNEGYPSVAETIAPLLEPDCIFHLVSRKRNKIVRLLEILGAVIRFGRKEQPIVIDVYSTLNFYYALLTGLLCRLIRADYFCVLHGGNLPARLQQNPHLCRLLFGGAKENIAPSGYLQTAFQRAGYVTRLIPNFIPIENYIFRRRTTLRPRLLWVRAFDASYNPKMAIQVLHLLVETYPDAELCMVGPDKDGSMADCQSLVQYLGLSERVSFTGRLPKADWIALSQDYDIFISTTNFDNTPVSVIEAMALGLPIVSTEVGGVPYLIENRVNGLLVEKGNAKATHEAICSLINNPLWANMLAQEARKKAETFTWERVKPLWLEIL